MRVIHDLQIDLVLPTAWVLPFPASALHGLENLTQDRVVLKFTPALVLVLQNEDALDLPPGVVVSDP
jgi:hypothetical protein